MREKAKQAQETARTLRDRLEPVLEALRPLNRAMQVKATVIIKSVVDKLLNDYRETQRQKIVERQKSRGKGRGGFSL